MPTIEFAGGSAEVRERPSVPGRTLISVYVMEMRRRFEADASAAGDDLEAEAEASNPDDKEATEAQSKRFQRRTSPATYKAIDNVRLACFLAMVKSWTLKTPLPKEGTGGDLLVGFKDIEDEQAQAAIYAVGGELYERFVELLSVPDFSKDGGYDEVDGKPVLVEGSPTPASSPSETSGSDTVTEASISTLEQVPA